MERTANKENHTGNKPDAEHAKSGSRVLVMCIGNYLMGDEGVGVHIAKAMDMLTLPGHIDVLDAGTGGFALMGYFDEYPAIIIVDATMDGSTPGTVRILEPKFASDFPTALSTHDIGLKDMIEVVYMKDDIPLIKLVTISIQSINPMTVELSTEVQRCMPEVIEQLVALSGELVISLENKKP